MTGCLEHVTLLSGRAGTVLSAQVISDSALWQHILGSIISCAQPRTLVSQTLPQQQACTGFGPPGLSQHWRGHEHSAAAQDPAAGACLRGQSGLPDLSRLCLPQCQRVLTCAQGWPPATASCSRAYIHGRGWGCLPCSARIQRMQSVCGPPKPRRTGERMWGRPLPDLLPQCVRQYG